MMHKKNSVALLAALALIVGGQTGCGGNNGGGNNGGGNNGGGNNGGGNDVGTNGQGNDVGTNGQGNDGGGNAALPTAVKTNIDVHNGGRIAVGDDLLVYGYGGFSGVDYIIPSAGDTAGRDLPNGDTYRASAFAVTGKKIALVNSFLITIYDTATETGTDIAEDTIRLENTPVGIESQGHIRAGGGYVVCRNSPSDNGGKKIIAIDVSGDTPNIISFDSDPEGNVDHIEIDVQNMEIAAKSGNMFYIYDIENPDAAPVVYDTTELGGISDTAYSFDGGYIFYEDNEAFGNVRFLNTADGTATLLTQNPSTVGEQCAAGGKYVYFANLVSIEVRAAVGDVPNANASLASNEFIDGSTTNNGRFGQAEACTITPDGAHIFISGKGSIGSGEFLQYYNGSWALVPDTNASSPYGLPATDVASSSTLVGFKTGDGTTTGPNTKVGYIILGN